MGSVARTVVPACESLCIFCPGLRTRSRHPVKRYKKLLADIFPKFQEEEPNDRKIGKLCEYASKNPLRIPKIADYLEQRCYKELRTERFGYVRTVLAIYRNLLVSCKEQMSLFASNLLNVIHTLLDQTRQDETQILGCKTLADFVANLVDSTYMSNVESLVPKLCQIAQEMGDNERPLLPRAAGLQALSSMVSFMGDHSHICADFDDVVSVVLDNYNRPQWQSELINQDSEGSNSHWVQEVVKVEGRVPPFPDVVTRASYWNRVINENGETNLTTEEANDPNIWATICLHSMTKLTKEAISTRRVLDSLFCYFDTQNLWSPLHGLALPVLLDMQFLLEKSGQKKHLLLSILIKHLDHKNISKQLTVQLNIVEVATYLAQHAKVQSSVAIIGSISDLMRYWRRSMHHCSDSENLGDDMIKMNKDFRSIIEECLVQLSDKVDDVGPLLDMMAMMLENIPTTPVVARTTISAVYRTSRIVASIPSLSLQNKEFPETLFHQLLLAMFHPDHETRVGSHRIFSIVLVPSSVQPRQHTVSSGAQDLRRTLSRTVSVFSSSSALFNKLKKAKSSLRESAPSGSFPGDGPQVTDEKTFSWQPSNRLLSIRSSALTSTTDRKSVSNYKELDFISLRLSSQQIGLLFSSIWNQATFPDNTPDNFEAIAHTYSLALLFSRANKLEYCRVILAMKLGSMDSLSLKTSNHEALIRSFQLAFSLRNISVEEGSLQPSRRRSLFTLATSMIVFLARAYNILSLIPCIKSCLTEATVDPYLRLVDDSKLQAVNHLNDDTMPIYGSEEDDISAIKSLSAIAISDDQTKESMASIIVKSLGKLSDSESSSVMKQMVDEFSHDDVCPLGAQLFLDTPGSCSPFVSKEYHSLYEIVPASFPVDDEMARESFERESNAGSSLQELPLLSVNQLLDSVLETARQVGRTSTSSEPDVPFSEMASKCEAVKMVKQGKLSTFMGIDHILEFPVARSLESPTEPRSPCRQEDQSLRKHWNPFLDDNAATNPAKSHGDLSWRLCSTEFQNQSPFYRLPASSPYDIFLKAAGC